MSHGVHIGVGSGEHHVDQWHHHSAAEGAPQEEHTGTVNPFLLAKWCGIIVATLVVTIGALWIYFDHYHVYLRQIRTEVSVTGGHNVLRETGETQLSAAGKPRQFIKLEGGAIAIPIDDAMKKVVAGYAGENRTLGQTLPKEHASIE